MCMKTVAFEPQFIAVLSMKGGSYAFFFLICISFLPIIQQVETVVQWFICNLLINLQPLLYTF